jgi:carbon monoxide dehydrogenase subunit G
MLEIVLIVVVVAVAGVLGLALLQPDRFSVERSTVVKAPPEKIFGMINDLHRFNAWNPYLKYDPETKGSYSGADQGKGAAYAWESKKVGTGRMEITETSAPSRVAMRLDFYRPFAGTNVAEFTIDGRADGTRVSWAMTGRKAFVPKLMGLFFSMDKMIGQSFEQGLADLKTQAEA